VEYSKNKFVGEVLDGQVVDDTYRVLDDVIFYKDWIYLVPKSTLKGKVLKGLKDDVLKHIQECTTCQKNSEGSQG
jgi:hypothetical protein